MKSFASLAAAASLLFSAAEAHTAFTTLWINGETQGDATCVRTTHRRDASNSPVINFSGDEIVCGFDGTEPVAYTCPAPQGAKLTFEFRMSPGTANSGFIAEGHKGPAAVYAKRIDSIEDSGAGDGWFKIWSEGYDMETDQWANEKLIEDNGYLSIDIPMGLPSGNYLFRPESIAMHNVTPEVEPQFYVGCAQVFLETPVTGDLVIPDEYRVSIPGYILKGEPSVTYNIYSDEEYADPKIPYPEPGPDAWVPPVPQSTSGDIVKQTEGAVPDSCLIVNGNWCGVEVSTYTDSVQDCWASQSECWKQADVCWDSAPITGGANCELWGGKCKALGESCEAGIASGPPEYEFDIAVRDDVTSLPDPKNEGAVASTIAVQPTSTATTQPTSTKAPVTTTTAAAPTITATPEVEAPAPTTLVTSVPTATETSEVIEYPTTTTQVASQPTVGCAGGPSKKKRDTNKLRKTHGKHKRRHNN